MSESTKQPLFLRLFGLPGITGIFFLAFFFLMLYGARIGSDFNVLRDSDTCWIITTGAWMIKNMAIPTYNIMDGGFYELSKVPSVCYQWLFEVLMGGFYLALGLHGVVLLSALLFGLIFVFMGLWLFERGFRGFPAIQLGMCLAIFVSYMYWSARPYLVSYLLTAVLLWLLAKPLSAKVRWVVFPLLFMLWANLHLAFTGGLLIFAVYSLYEYWKSRNPKTLYLVGLCVLATCVNPYGVTLYSYLFDLGNSPFMNDHIQELKSIDFHGAVAMLVYIMLALVSACWVIQNSRIHPVERLMFFIGLGLMLFSSRHAYLFILFSLPVIVLAIETAWQRYLPDTAQGWGEIFTKDNEKPFYWVVLAVLVGVFLSWQQVFPAHFNKRAYPAGAIAYLKQNPPDKLILTEGKWGSYLIWFTEDVRGYLDSRFDMYGDRYVRNFISAFELRPGWENFFEITGIELAMYPKPSLQVDVLQKIHGWSTVYEDDQTIILRKMPEAGGAPKQLMDHLQ